MWECGSCGWLPTDDGNERMSARESSLPTSQCRLKAVLVVMWDVCMRCGALWMLLACVSCHVNHQYDKAVLCTDRTLRTDGRGRKPNQRTVSYSVSHAL